MSLIITFMFEPAKLQMNCAKAKGTSTRRKALEGRPVAWLPATVYLPRVNAVMSTEPAPTGLRSLCRTHVPDSTEDGIARGCRGEIVARRALHARQTRLSNVTSERHVAL
jgi:hypothetical protein